MSAEIRNLVHCLQEVKSHNCYSPELARQNYAKAEKVFNLIYEIGVEKRVFTAEESKAIGSLLIDAIKPLKINIERAGCLHRTRLNTSILRKRSALQFLIDNYSNFPAGDTTLSSIFQRSNIQESIEILDDIIEKWRDVSDSDEGETDHEIETGLPSSHTWWTQ